MARSKTGLDAERMAGVAQDYEDERGTGEGGELYTPEMGQALMYVCPPCDPDDEHEHTAGLPFILVKVHYLLGGGMTLCMDPKNNPILTHPHVLKAIDVRNEEREGDDKIIIEDGFCQACKALGGLSKEDANEMRAQDKWLWGVAEMGYREKPSDKWKEHGDLVFQPFLSPLTIWRGFVAKLTEDPRADYTDPEAATFLVLEKRERAKKKRGRRGGGGFSNIEYEVSVDARTLRNPVAFSPDQSKALDEALGEGGDCDLFRVVANFAKSDREIDEALDEASAAAPADDGRRGGSRRGGGVEEDDPRDRGRGRGREEPPEESRGRGRGAEPEEPRRGRGRDEPEEPPEEPRGRGRGRGRAAEPEDDREPEEPPEEPEEPRGRGRGRGRGDDDGGKDRGRRGSSESGDDGGGDSKVEDELAALEKELGSAADTRERSRASARSAAGTGRRGR
jgi:hypothetical protein